MRTTVTLDDDVLRAVRSMAQARGTTAGHVLSELARKALTVRKPGTTRSGLPLFPVRKNAGAITLEIVQQAEDEA